MPEAQSPVPTDTGFTRTVAARTESLLNTQARPSTGLEEFSPPDLSPETDVSVYDSFSAAVSDSGVVTGAVRALRDDQQFHPDPNYDLEAHLMMRPDDLKTIKPFMDNPDDPASGSVLGLLADSRSAQETESIIQRLRDAQERVRVARANGWIPEFMGMVGGIGIDVVSLAAIAALSRGAGLAGLPGAKTLVAGTSAGGRALATGRLAAIGAIEGASERAVQQITNPLIADQDLLTAAGFGGGAGAFLGFAFPTLLGNVKRVSQDITEPARMSDDLIDEAAQASGRGDAGAARAPGTEPRVAEPARGSGSLAAKRLPKGLQESILRSPKRVLTDIGAKGFRDKADKGLEGGSKFFDVMSRVVRLSTVMSDEVGGKAGRRASVQDMRDQFRAFRLAREEEVSREYASLMKDVFGVGGIRRVLRNNNLKSIKRHLISQDQFEAMADEYAIAKAQDVLDKIEYIPDEILRRLTPDQEAELRSRVAQTAAKEDEYYQRFGALEVKHGLIDEEDLIPGYRPQRWNREEIAKDPQGFQQYLLEVFSKEPDEDWVREVFQVRKDDGSFEPILNKGETFAQLSKREPELANEILEEWALIIKRDAEEKAFVLRQTREQELQRVRGEAETAIDTRITERLSRDRTLYTRVEQRLQTEQDVAVRNKLATRLSKIEARIAKEEQKLAALRVQSRTEESIDAFIRRFGNVEQKRALNKVTRLARKAARKEATVSARRLVGEQIAEIRRAILDGDSPFAFIDQEFIQTSGRFKRRNIHLGRHRFRPEARRFLLTSTHDARAAFDSSVGTQIAMREVFGPELAREGESFSLERLRQTALEGYDEDLRKTTSSAERGRIAKERDRARRMFDHILEELTHADIANLRGIRRSVSDLVSVTNTLTAAMSLGSVALAQLGDLAVQVMAGGRIGTGFRALWRGGGVKTHIREIAADEQELAVLIQGPSVLDASRFKAIAELDTLDFDVPGGRFRRVMRASHEIAMIEGWANLMHVWNTIVRGGFGLDFARQLDADVARYATLPAHLKTFYAKLGIDEKTAREMAEMMDRAHRTAVDGKLRIPHSSKWADERPDLLTKYQIAIKAAGDEAMIDPSVADRPFLRSFPGGRLILQFQSFMFTAGERFLAPMIQELQLHPTSVRPYFAALGGLFLGAMTDGLKSAVRGEFEAWSERWEDPEGWKDNLWGAVLRSPMMAGPSATLTDVGMSTFGRVMNDRLEDVTGVRPLREEATRFRENQGLFALFGPAPGTIAGTLPAIVRRFIEGDIDEAAAMTARRIPVLNVFYLHMLARLAETE